MAEVLYETSGRKYHVKGAFCLRPWHQRWDISREVIAHGGFEPCKRCVRPSFEAHGPSDLPQTPPAKAK